MVGAEHFEQEKKKVLDGEEQKNGNEYSVSRSAKQRHSCSSIEYTKETGILWRLVSGASGIWSPNLSLWKPVTTLLSYSSSKKAVSNPKSIMPEYTVAC